MLNIVTATLNRCTLLERLYLSLLEQSDLEFKWVVVDDGSSDGTRGFLNAVATAKDRKFEFEYHIHERNRGKHVAINSAISFCKYEYTMIVDSDDLLYPDAVECVKDLINCGVRFCIFPTMQGVPFEYAGTSVSYRQYFKISQDCTRVVPTSEMAKRPFPDCVDEFFLTEAYLWSALHRRNCFHAIGRRVVQVEYQCDGLSSRYKSLVFRNPKGSIKTAIKVILMPTFGLSYFKFVSLHLLLGITGLIYAVFTSKKSANRA
ncbi:glycosyltransferase family A protein [Pseudoduganella sp. GCM10020061]|uniref:glycosyltransferase family A protein n=1 Tax=Pseudoduganella sp. GCM10020061 TaxID=3317345 RepID=UPI0036252A83